MANPLTPLVLEADERVGGRLLTPRRSWIGDTHQRMFQLAAELGVETYPQYDEGETSYEVGGCGVLRENEFHSRFALRRLDVLAADVPVEAPWLAPRATEWDAITALAT